MPATSAGLRRATYPSGFKPCILSTLWVQHARRPNGAAPDAPQRRQLQRRRRRSRPPHSSFSPAARVLLAAGTTAAAYPAPGCRSHARGLGGERHGERGVRSARGPNPNLRRLPGVSANAHARAGSS
jgi:hypothetical protein